LAPSRASAEARWLRRAARNICHFRRPCGSGRDAESAFVGTLMTEDEWQARATTAAIAAARKVVAGQAPPPIGTGNVPLSTPIERFDDTEWGWIVAAVIFAWISVRAEQATAESLDVEATIRTTDLDPEPWDAGAVAAILPELSHTPGIDWSKSIGEWPRETMVLFLTAALALIRKAVIARDVGGGTITRKRQPAELDDPIPF
jgi:hypothetical protein